ncbi:MAG: carboxymuconolactone decarboxylase family protein [Synechococcaceae cyanobacterium ELA739]
MGQHSKLYAKGLEEMRRHLGPQADQLIGRIEAISAEFAKVNVEFPYGELYTRQVLDPRVRELCTVAALTVQGFSSPQLKLHIAAALHCGASKEEVIEIITQMIAYAGFPAATNALLAAGEVFDQLEAAA